MRLGLRLDRKRIHPGLQLNRANIAFDEVLEMACVLNRHFQRLISNREINFCTAAAFTATLQRENFEFSRRLDDEFPTDPIFLDRPITHRVLFRLRFIADHFPMDRHIARMQKNRAIGGAFDRPGCGMGGRRAGRGRCYKKLCRNRKKDHHE